MRGIYDTHHFGAGKLLYDARKANGTEVADICFGLCDVLMGSDPVVELVLFVSKDMLLLCSGHSSYIEKNRLILYSDLV